jgi:hypothetical protein
MKLWLTEEIDFLKKYYPQNGRIYCARLLGRSEASIRQKTSNLKLKIDRKSDFCKEYQERAAKAKIGVKKPHHSLLMKEKYKNGMTQMTDWVKSNGAIISKMAKERIEKNGHPRGALGMKHTKETKELISKKSKKMWESWDEEKIGNWVMKVQKTRAEKNILPVERKASWKGAWREIGGINKYYRSAWEANYARYLQWLKENNQIKDWKHEPKTFWFDGIKRGCVSYLPDFWVQELNDSESYHEIKGWMDDRSKTKIKRMGIYHPNVKLIVIDSKAYKEIAKKAKLFVANWE